MLPLCEITAMGPAGTPHPSTFTRPEALKRPAQLGPIMRPPASRSRRAIACSTALPSGPVSPKPAVMTTTAGTVS